MTIDGSETRRNDAQDDPGRRPRARLAVAGISPRWRAGRRVVAILLTVTVAVGCSSTPSDATWLELRDEAQAAAARQDFALAEERVALALQKNPRDASSHYLHAMLLARRGDQSLAQVGLQRTLSIDPTHHDALYNLGTLALIEGDAPRAIPLLERAAELQPNHAKTLTNLGKAYYASGLPELALMAFEGALAADPAADSARQNLAMLLERPDVPSAPPAEDGR